MKIFYTVVAVILVLVPAAWFGGRWILSFSTADYQGAFQLTGIIEPVEITFDAKGIPQIWAKSDQDLVFALGWLHASERLFQMELVRRLANGDLSEIFGSEAYSYDLFQRKIGFARTAHQDSGSFPQQSLDLLQSYCAGINAWIENRSILPPEFIILGFKPKPWQPVDCISIGLFQNWYAHELMNDDNKYTELFKIFGSQLSNTLCRYPQWTPPTIHDSSIEKLSDNMFLPLRMSLASNSWVVSPEKSISGAALHASDPHLALNMTPAFWYIAGLHSETGTNILGITAPGLPYVLMGHNGHIAFAFTVAAVDLIDYYRYKINPGDSLQVLTENGYQNMKAVIEEINIKGSKTPKRVPVYFTDRGVVVERDSNFVVSLKWAGFDFPTNDLFISAYNLQKAKNFAEFQQAVTNMGALAANWIYSDINGNIGYQLGCPIPGRVVANSFIQLAGDDSSTDWQGYYPPEQIPYSLNPKEGWLASCNNWIVSDNWSYDIPGFYDPYRIIRAKDHLSKKKKYSVKDFTSMQLDQVSAIALRWKNLLADGADKLNKPELAKKMRDWNGAMAAEDSLPGLFRLWWEFLARVIFEDQMGDRWHLGNTIKEQVLSSKLESIIDDVTTVDLVENLTDISARALELALEKWDNRTYGAMTQLKISHPLSMIKLLDTWLNLTRGPIPVGGDNGSLNANWSSYDFKKNRFHSLVGASMRYVLDWANIDSFKIIINLGQSGNPFSSHYDDFLELWQNGQDWLVPFSKEAVYSRSKSKIILVPQNN